MRMFLPRKDVFFQYMEEAADKAVEMVALFQVLLDHMDDPKPHVDKILALEHEADEGIHRMFSELHQSFVTPLDRNEISAICKRLDDIVDLVEGAAQRIFHYQIRQGRPELRTLVAILAKQVGFVRQAVGGLSNLKKDPDGLRAILIEINTAENEADHILRATIGALFRDETDTREILKWKEVYEHIEKATDRCEDVADQIENILLEYA